jgi:hypothetical protein
MTGFHYLPSVRQTTSIPACRVCQNLPNTLSTSISTCDETRCSAMSVRRRLRGSYWRAFTVVKSVASPTGTANMYGRLRGRLRRAA